MRLGQINSDFTEGKITAEEGLYEQERVESLKQDGVDSQKKKQMLLIQRNQKYQEQRQKKHTLSYAIVVITGKKYMKS